MAKPDDEATRNAIGEALRVDEGFQRQLAEIGSTVSISEGLRQQLAEAGGTFSIAEGLRQQLAEAGGTFSLGEFAELGGTFSISERMRQQLAEAVSGLVREIDSYESPEDLGAVIEQAAPEIAKRVRTLPTLEDVVCQELGTSVT